MNTIKSFLLALVLFACFIAGNAQQLPLYSQFMMNDYVMNPAIGGKNHYIEAKSNNRYQWTGITDAPRTYMLSVNGATKSGKIGLGGYLFTDIVGPSRRIGFDVSYAYHIQLNSELKLSLGLSAGLLQFAVDGSKIYLRDATDDIISSGYQSLLMPDFGAGFYLYTRKWYVGASVPQIYPAKISFVDYTTQNQGKLATHVYASAGYRINVADNFYIGPCMQFKYVSPVPMQFDFGSRFVFKENYWIGGAYRTHDAFVAMLGFTFHENLSFSYSYDFTTTALKNYSGGTHELMIAIKFNKQSEQSSK